MTGAITAYSTYICACMSSEPVYSAVSGIVCCLLCPFPLICVCRDQVSGTLARHQEDFSAQHDKDTTVLSHASARLSSVDGADLRCLLFQSDIEQCLLCSVRCYENAQTSAQSGGLEPQRELGTCLGSAWNEMGLYYMQLSETFSVDTGQ